MCSRTSQRPARGEQDGGQPSSPCRVPGTMAPGVGGGSQAQPLGSLPQASGACQVTICRRGRGPQDSRPPTALGAAQEKMENSAHVLCTSHPNKIFIISRNKSLKKEREKSVSIAFPQQVRSLVTTEFLQPKGPPRPREGSWVGGSPPQPCESPAPLSQLSGPGLPPWQGGGAGLGEGVAW